MMLDKNYVASFIKIFILGLNIYLPAISYAACEGESGDDNYGNAELCDFKNAVEGTEVLSPKDQAFLASVDYTRLINRWYLKAFVGKPKVRILNLNNISTTPTFTGQPADTTVENHILQGSVAGGYIWQQWALEAELYGTKKINFSLDPIIPGTPINGVFKLQYLALFVNLEYIIPRFVSWYPQRLQIHLNAGGGGAYSQTSLNTYNPNGSPRQGGSKHNISPAGNLGAGLRYQVTAHWLVDVSYRFFSLGKTEYNAEGGLFKSNQTQSQGWFLGAMYEF